MLNPGEVKFAWEMDMTCCVAALAENSRALILVSDRMVGFGWVEAELKIKKSTRVHRDWWVMMSGTVSPVFDIIDYTRDQLSNEANVDVRTASETVLRGYQEKRDLDAETLHLKPAGFSRADLPNIQGSDPQKKYSAHKLGIDLIITGFDKSGKAHIVSLHGDRFGELARRDSPGFHSIGTGSVGAMYMMFYKDYSPRWPLLKAVYYTVEGKYFGEMASGVGWRSDVYVVRAGQDPQKLSKKSVENIIIEICENRAPRKLKRKHLKQLREIKELKGFLDAKK